MKITDKLVLFFGNNDICSNFYLCEVYYDGYIFNSSEQLFMYLKATFFKDWEIAEAIRKVETPREAKALGRKVRNYNNELWDKYRDYYMLETLMAKYVNCLKFRNFLLENKDKTFVEASPYDSIWGIKLSEDDPKALNPSQWKGENRLGKCINRLISIL